MRFLGELSAVFASVKGFLPDDEATHLYEAARQAYGDDGARKVGVEIGTYCGKSSVVLGAAARETSAVVVTIDHHRGSDEHQVGWEYHDASLVGADGQFDTLPTLRDTLSRAGLDGVVQPLVAASAQVAAWWGIPVDFVFIDGGHTDEAAQTDLAGWAPWVRPDGVLIIHDVFVDPADGGQAPYRIWLAALESGNFVEDSVCGSLRVLRRVAPARRA